eukprot:12035372-Heterocapsa_arctica.AAC.1
MKLVSVKSIFAPGSRAPSGAPTGPRGAPGRSSASTSLFKSRLASVKSIFARGTLAPSGALTGPRGAPGQSPAPTPSFKS